MKVDTNTKFNYVIGKPWYNNSNQLNIYAYGSEVFYGTMKDAKNTLEFINGRDDNGPNKIYIISDDGIE